MAIQPVKIPVKVIELLLKMNMGGRSINLQTVRVITSYYDPSKVTNGSFTAFAYSEEEAKKFNEFCSLVLNT